jgi:hypothetical protein
MNGDDALSKRRMVSLFAGVGLALPALWLAFYWAFLKNHPSLISSIMGSMHFDRLLLVVWPSWIFFLADPEEKSIAIPIVSVVVNAALYAAVGWLVWLGLYRHKAILAGAIALIAAGWYFLLSWYAGG